MIPRRSQSQAAPGGKGTSPNTISDKIDTAIRFLLYAVVLWLPYSKAAIEIGIGVSSLLWLIKRSLRAYGSLRAGHSLTPALKSFCPRQSPLNKAIGLFFMVAVAAMIGSAFWDQAGRGLVSKTAEWFVIYFLVIEVFTQRRHFYVLGALFCCTTLLTAWDAQAQFYFLKNDLFRGRMMTDGVRATAGFDHSNGLGAYLAFALPLLIALMAAAGERSRKKALCLVIIFFSGWALALSRSRGACFSAMAGTVLFFMMKGISCPQKKRLKRKRTVFISGIIIMAALSAAVSVPFFQARQEKFRTSLTWRLRAWQDCLVMIKDRPLLGHGPNTFMKVFREYQAVNPAYRGREQPPSYAHNSLLQLTAETGVLGLAMFLLIIVSLVRTLSQALCRSGGERTDFVILSGLGAGLGALFLHSLMDTDLSSLQLSALFWLAVGITVSWAEVLCLKNNYAIKTN